MSPDYFFPTRAEHPYWIGFDDGLAGRPSRVAQYQIRPYRREYGQGYVAGQLTEATQAADRADNFQEVAA